MRRQHMHQHNLKTIPRRMATTYMMSQTEGEACAPILTIIITETLHSHDMLLESFVLTGECLSNSCCTYHIQRPCHPHSQLQPLDRHNYRSK
jgi:hypothetical protein